MTAKPNPNDQASTMYALRAGMRLSFSLFYFNDSPQLKLHTHTKDPNNVIIPLEKFLEGLVYMLDNLGLCAIFIIVCLDVFVLFDFSFLLNNALMY